MRQEPDIYVGAITAKFRRCFSATDRSLCRSFPTAAPGSVARAETGSTNGLSVPEAFPYSACQIATARGILRNPPTGKAFASCRGTGKQGPDRVGKALGLPYTLRRSGLIRF